VNEHLRDVAASFQSVAAVWRTRADVMDADGIDLDLDGRTADQLRRDAARIVTWPHTLTRRDDVPSPHDDGPARG
jgi:hypothetical protein